MSYLNLKNFLYVLFILNFYSCQPSASSSEVEQQPLEPKIDKRYDQSPIVEINNDIETKSSISRKLPLTQDSRITYCESVNGELDTYSGIQDHQKYPLASLSKIFLSAWALHVLGPQFKFETTWNLKKVDQLEGVFDAYLNTNYDPVMNIEKIFYMLSILKKNGVVRIRHLVIDQTTRVFLSVLNDPHYSDYTAPIEITKSKENLQIILNSKNWGPQSILARNNILEYSESKNVAIHIPSEFSVEKVIYTESKDIKKSYYDKEIKISSSPLLDYLKEINVNSNNYISDSLFNLLGGANAFRKFQIEFLKIKDADLSLQTGSGLPVNLMSIRSDNKGNCISVLKSLKFIDVLSNQLKLNLSQFLLNAGTDEGTYKSEFVFDFSNTVVLKTGRLIDVPALNLAGIANLKTKDSKKSLYFSFLAHNFDNNDEKEIKKIRDQFIKSFMIYYPLKPVFTKINLDRIFF